MMIRFFMRVLQGIEDGLEAWFAILQFLLLWSLVPAVLFGIPYLISLGWHAGM